MKYLVNRETKEHRVLPDNAAAPYAAVLCDQLTDGEWHVVEADAEGWIKWAGKQNPLPEEAECEMKWSVGLPTTRGRAGTYYWAHSHLTHYRPILDKPEVEQVLDMCAEQAVAELETKDIISRLKSAHEAAQSIPDLLAELREALGPELLRMLADLEKEND